MPTRIAHAALLLLTIGAIQVIPATLGEAVLVPMSDGSLALSQKSVHTATPRIDALSAGEAGLSVRVELAAVPLDWTSIGESGDFAEVNWFDAPLAGAVGTPGVPVVRRLLVAPPHADVRLDIHYGEPYLAEARSLDINLTLLPVQPPVEKIPGARDEAPFVYDANAYALDADVPAERATLTEVGTMRGQRLLLLEVQPIAYNAAREQILLWTDIEVVITFAGDHDKAATVDYGPPPGLADVVLNPDLLPPAYKTSGNYLIVVANTFENDIASFATAKTAQGYNVTTYPVASGTSASAIQSYLQTQYASATTAPAYVLLVGDTNTIPHWTGAGMDSPATDLYYACMDGGSDWVPDFALGRLPVRSAAQLAAIVAKTLHHDDGPIADPSYLKRGAFIASTDNSRVTETTHNYVVNTHLLTNSYSTDLLYPVSRSTSNSELSAALNAGRFYSVYSGHGMETGWYDSLVYTQNDVRSMTNTDMYAFVWSFACLTGKYTETECFMETWVLQPDAGAVASVGSSVTSFWDEDDILERRLFDAIFDYNDSVATRLGPVINETRARYLAHYGTGGYTQRYFEMYNLFGDPALPLPGACDDPLMQAEFAGLEACTAGSNGTGSVAGEGTSTSDPLSSSSAPGCGAGMCGAGVMSCLPLMLVALGAVRLGQRRRWQR